MSWDGRHTISECASITLKPTPKSDGGGFVALVEFEDGDGWRVYGNTAWEALLFAMPFAGWAGDHVLYEQYRWKGSHEPPSETADTPR